MVLERAEILAKTGTEDEFDGVLKGPAANLLSSLDGVKSVNVGRGVENPNKFILLLEWDSVEAHVAATSAPAFAEFRALIGPYGAGGSMEHFKMA